MQSKRKQTIAYIAVVAACYAIGMYAGWSPAGERINNDAYDWLATRPSEGEWTPQSVVLAIDEQTLEKRGGMRNYRPILAEALTHLAAAHPRAVALDITLHDATDEADDQQLETALRGVQTVLVLPCAVIASEKGFRWEDPLPRFQQLTPHLGHVYRGENRTDGVNRELPLEVIADGRQRWALALEAFSMARQSPIIQSPDDVAVGETQIPARRSDDRKMFIRYSDSPIPRVSVLDIDAQLDRLRDKVVFVGVTAVAAGDRPVTTYGHSIPGVEVNAQAFETIARGNFLTTPRVFTVPLLCGLFATAAALIFALLRGWQAYVAAAVPLLLAHWIPLESFRHDIVFEDYFALISVAWLSTVGAASYQYFFVQRALKKSESEKSRYQQAIHWAAHEMRTPLTAIQGSSEIMTRYALPQEKQKQLSEMINSESKRLARLIQTFLDVERLAEGQMELKRELFEAAAVVDTCLARVAPIAERKKIGLFLDTEVNGVLTGDRELMEYAVYNLLTNAVKYSPAETEVHVASKLRGDELHLSIRDQGIGMDQKELKSIFKKFYRTKKAEMSGEAGTGIGLSIVQQIVTTHGGRMEVSSAPGRGSCFTMIVTAHAKASDRRG
ncbi:MAG: CHASE2 domain-containing protein [Acidobacteriia bacterium]|nr:CHASE2 domain-containing protein [Terriglobia bacterium]